jgi:hypothetical protein
MMALNGHQLAAGKRLKSHDEHLRLIIPVSAVTIRLVSSTVGILECSNVVLHCSSLNYKFGFDLGLS